MTRNGDHYHYRCANPSGSRGQQYQKMAIPKSRVKPPSLVRTLSAFIKTLIAGNTPWAALSGTVPVWALPGLPHRKNIACLFSAGHYKYTTLAIETGHIALLFIIKSYIATAISLTYTNLPLALLDDGILLFLLLIYNYHLVFTLNLLAPISMPPGLFTFSLWIAPNTLLSVFYFAPAFPGCSDTLTCCGKAQFSTFLSDFTFSSLSFELLYSIPQVLIRRCFTHQRYLNDVHIRWGELLHFHTQYILWQFAPQTI